MIDFYHNTDDIPSILQRSEKLFSSVERSNAVQQWELLARYILPNQSGTFLSSGGFGSTPGEKKTVNLYDSTAPKAVQDLASFMQSTITNPATHWSRSRFISDKLNDDKQAVSWLEQSNKLVYQELNDSNFNTEVGKNYRSYATFGNMILFQEDGDRKPGKQHNGFRFAAWHIAEVAWCENSDGIVDTIYRKFKLTAKQVLEKFPESASKLPKVVAAMETNPEEEITIVHCVFPRRPSEVKLNDIGLAKAEQRPIASLYIIESEKVLVREDGYYEFPVYVTRWDTLPGSVYAYGPGHVALPDIRTLNKLKELILQNGAKNLDPPTIVRERGVSGSLNLGARGVTVVKSMEDVRYLQSGTDIRITQFTAEDLIRSIKEMFYIDKLMLPPRTETGEMTAFEIAKRIEQMQRVLGPVLGRLNSEQNRPLIINSFKKLLRAGALPPLPPILKAVGVDIEIEFVNQFAQAQRLEDLTNIQTWIGQVGQMAQLNPAVLDLVDFDEVVYTAGRIIGVPEQTMKDTASVQQERQQRAKSQATQQALQGGVQLGDMASKFSNSQGGQ